MFEVLPLGAANKRRLIFPPQRIVHLLVSLILACSVEPVLAQMNPFFLIDRGSPAQWVDRDTSRQPLVSINQLLTPRKALEAAERSHQYFIRGQMDLAQKEVTRALEIAPGCGLALQMQGSIYFMAGRLEEAVKAYQKAINADPSLGAAYLGLGTVLASQARFKEALIPLDRATAFLPSAWLVYFEIALSDLGVGDTAGALKQLTYSERFMGANPERVSGVAYLRGRVYVRLKDFVAARRYLAEAVTRDPNGHYGKLANRSLERVQPLMADAR